MISEGIIQDVGLMIVAATLITMLLQRLNVPTIVSYLLAGLALGPVSGLVSINHSIEIMSEVGIALLLFLVGLELSLDKIKDVGKVAVIAGLGQVIFTAAGGFLLSFFLGFSAMESIFLAIALTFSSTVVVVKLLDQKGELDSLYGRIAVGIFLVQDLVVIFALTLLSALDGTAGQSIELTTLILNIIKAFGGTAVLLVAALISAKYILPRPFAWAARSQETIFIWSLCWCFIFVTLSQILQLSLEIGAFLAGISLAQLPYNHDLRRRVHPLMSFFIAIFFVLLGIQMDLSSALTHAGSALILSLFVLIGNPFIFMWIIARQGYAEKTTFFTSITVAQISEFSFIFAAMGIATGLISPTIMSLIALVGLITIATSSYMIIYNEQLYRWTKEMGLLKLFRASQQLETQPQPEFDNHIIVIGMNSLGTRIANALFEQGEQVLAIDTDPGKLSNLPMAVMSGNVDYQSTLDDAGITRAKLVVSALHIEDANKLLAYRCQDLNIPCCIHAFDESVIPALQQLNVSYLLTPKRDSVAQQIEFLLAMEGTSS